MGGDCKQTLQLVTNNINLVLQVRWLCRWLRMHHRFEEQKGSTIGRSRQRATRQRTRHREPGFKILRKCRSKFDFLIYEFLFIKGNFVFRTFSQDLYVGCLDPLLFSTFIIKYIILFYRAPLKTTTFDVGSLFKYFYYYY